MNNLTIELKEIIQGEYHIVVNRPMGTVERKVLSQKALDEYIKSAEDYCRHKDYKLIVKGF